MKKKKNGKKILKNWKFFKMNKIIYVADFFSEHIQGGAELGDEVLISHLQNNGYHVEKKTCRQLFVEDGCFYIVSNFVSLDENKKLALLKQKYIIIEHDHKYLKSRNPSKFVNFIASEDEIINKDFYHKAQRVFVFSKQQKEIMNSNLGNKNIVNLGVTFWSQKQLEHIRHTKTASKLALVHGILNSPNAIKNTAGAVARCKKNDWKYNLIQDPSWFNFIKKLGECEFFLFIPKVFETYSRVVMEAKMLNVKVKTNRKLVGALSEDNANLSGEDLIDDIEKRILCAFKKIKQEIKSDEEDFTHSDDMTVILNVYRRPHLLKEQIHAIRNQTMFKNAEIWVWVNYHEDNQDFDFKSLDCDRITINDHNWKYFGRYSLAMLSQKRFISFFDDDTIPGSKWFENCLRAFKEHGENVVLGGAGIILEQDDYFHHKRSGWAVKNEEDEEVDLIGHAWFLTKDILKHVWREEPFSYETGEDIHLSAMAQKYGNCKTFTPRHPDTDRELWSSLKGNQYGIDKVASSKKENHLQFYALRDKIVYELIQNGWRTVKRKQNV